jgi:predicted DNA-binding transcriptional regulator YafY
MNREDINTFAGRSSNRTLIIAVVAVVLVVIVMYCRDRQKQRDFELRRLEKRVELLEDWNLPARNKRDIVVFEHKRL